MTEYWVDGEPISAKSFYDAASQFVDQWGGDLCEGEEILVERENAVDPEFLADVDSWYLLSHIQDAMIDVAKDTVLDPFGDMHLANVLASPSFRFMAESAGLFQALKGLSRLVVDECGGPAELGPTTTRTFTVHARPESEGGELYILDSGE
jgi:hypothetical protein